MSLVHPIASALVLALPVLIGPSAASASDGDTQRAIVVAQAGPPAVLGNDLERTKRAAKKADDKKKQQGGAAQEGKKPAKSAPSAQDQAKQRQQL